MTKKKTYTPAPEVPIEVEARYRAVLEVLSGTTSVSEAARRLGMSRMHFQTLMHRSLEGMIEGLTPGKAGRPAKPAREVELEAERDKLLRKTEQLEQRLDMTTRLMGLASELMKGSAPRTRSKKKSEATVTEDDESDEPPSSLRDLARRLEVLELPRVLIARSLDIPESTLRRWATAEDKPPVKRRISPPVDVVDAMVRDIRELRGLPGADALHQRHPQVSRRQAAEVKRETLTDMERERREAHSRVTVTVPGVLRGFDAMERGHHASPRYVLVAGDGCVAYRTSIEAAECYDDPSVARFLDDDFTRNGPPLVLRLDRAKAHSALQTTAVLAAHRVLVLQGPPHHPCFYGQLERMNRDHVPWVHDGVDDDIAPFNTRLQRMRNALNGAWPRRSLGWRTPAHVWNSRPHVDVDRAWLHDSVHEHARTLREHATQDTMTEDLARRLAIEHALTKLGYLRIEIRRPLLGDRQVLKQAI